MNVGFGSLTNLKKAVLPEGLRARTSWDEQLTTVGLGVAAMMGNYCNRNFERSVGGTQIFRANCTAVSLECYPLEAVSKVETKMSAESSYTELTGVVANFFEDSGIVEFTQILGTNRDKARVTYTGGFWWDTSEDDSGTQPTGSAIIPDDIVHAWHLQCQEVLERTGILKAAATRATDFKADHGQQIGDLDLLPEVKGILDGYVRHA